MRLLPIMEPCHPTRVSLTVVACSQWTLKRANSNCLRTLTLTQWRRMWFVDSSSYLQKKHLLTKGHSLFWSWSIVNTFPKLASHAKKLALESTQEFQVILVTRWKGNQLPRFQCSIFNGYWSLQIFELKRNFVAFHIILEWIKNSWPWFLGNNWERFWRKHCTLARSHPEKN